MTSAACLLFALLLDALIGDPPRIWNRLPHPVVVMGRLLDWLELKLNKGDATSRSQKGIIMMAGLISAVMQLGVMLENLDPVLGPALSVAVEITFAAILIAQRSLCDHVSDVAKGLRNNLHDGRHMVARIVGRDVEGMDHADVARSAIESGAENFSDGMIAPAFWYLVLGLPGLLAYKIINTADSMVGYRSARFEAFGWAPARLDDAVNWVPARLSAGLILLSRGQFAFCTREFWSRLHADATRHRSPNAGWPEAAMAVVLDVALSGPRSYDGVRTDQPYVNANGKRALNPEDIEASITVLWRSWAIWLGCVATFALIL